MCLGVVFGVCFGIGFGCVLGSGVWEILLCFPRRNERGWTMERGRRDGQEVSGVCVFGWWEYAKDLG